jgi:hypothetical protein
VTQQTGAEQQADATAEKVAALLTLYASGSIPETEFPSVVAAAIYRGKVLASRAADIAVSTLANRPPLGILPGAQHLDRLAEAVETARGEETAQEDAGGLAERLARLAEAETLQSAQMTTRAAIEAQGFTQYREDVAADACEKCQPFADEIRESEEDWTPHHPHCRCELVPVGQPQEEAA